MIFNGTKFKDAMNTFLAYADTLLPYAVQSEIDRQRREYESNIKRIMDSSGASLEKVVDIKGQFVSDNDDAQRFAKTAIAVGIGNRIRGAIACHEVGNEIECARLLTLAQAEVFNIIGMGDGASALNRAAGFIFEQVQGKKAA